MRANLSCSLFRASGIALVLVVFCLFNFDYARGQSSSSVFWRYDAPGRLNIIEVEDIDGDGIDEILVVSDDVNVMLLGADGRPLWPAPYRAITTITAVSAANLNDPSTASNQIALSTADQLILLNNEGQELWRRNLEFMPAAMVVSRGQSSDPAELIVAGENGRLQRFNGSGQLTWEYEYSDPPADSAFPKLLAEDINRDGYSDLLFSYTTNQGFSQLVMLDHDGNHIWERLISGSLRAIETVEFHQGQPLEIAVSTSLKRVYLYNADGQPVWPYRSPNKAITGLAAADLEPGKGLIVGTAVGTVTAYDSIGRRFWTRPYSVSADRPITKISVPADTDADDPIAMGVILGTNPEKSVPSEFILLDANGRRLEPSFPTSDESGLSRLVDVNHDGRSELLLAGFATLELLDPGIGVRQYSQSWDYRLDAEPKSVLVSDINRDGIQEILIGTDDGRLHALSKDGSLQWVSELEGVITNLVIARGLSDSLPLIAVAHNAITPLPGQDISFQGWISVLRPDGRLLWTAPFASSISTLITGDINNNDQPEIIAGTTDGIVAAISIEGNEFWRTPVNASVNQLLLVDGTRGSEVIIGTGAGTIDRLNNKGAGPIRSARFLDGITHLNQGNLSQELGHFLVVGLEDGTLRALNSRGNQIWTTNLGGIPQLAETAENSLMIGTDEQELVRVDYTGNILWRLPDMGYITSLYWGDLDGDIRPDVAVGNREGLIQLLTGDDIFLWDVINVGSEVFFVSGLKGSAQENTELTTVTDNGVVSLYRSQAKHPPLVINPELDVGAGKYGISVSVLDIEAKPVQVTLEIFNPDANQWIEYGGKTSEGTIGTLFWQVNPVPGVGPVRYRFRYDDGSHIGVVEPSPGPPPVLSSALNTTVIALIVLVVSSTAGAALFVRQTRTNTSRIRRFYQQTEQAPAETLQRLELEYKRTKGSPDFLLNLAGTARQLNNLVLANLSDGLYLLDARPDSAMPIINSALRDAEEIEPRWWTLSQWLIAFQIGQSLLQAPSITELALLRTQFEDALETLKKVERPVEGFLALRPVLTSIRDGERVDLIQDRLLYFTECSSLLDQIIETYEEWPESVDNTIAKGIARRWSGQIRAEMDELKGRAQLVVTLITKHIIPDENTIVALDVKNVGQAKARDLEVKLEHNPAFRTSNSSVVVPLLSPGMARQVQFSIEPASTEPFRIVFALNFNDQNQVHRRQAFADQIHILQPVEEFIPVINPYAPGMPLRLDSAVFFGREDLFQFVRENVGKLAQRNVLIFVGQRRTGKTSALLRLEHHLPHDKIPVYIDCQSLGVTPGMAALLHDIAWTISDALSDEIGSIKVGDLVQWSEDPSSVFQRKFLPTVRKHLPEGASLVLIFDEFEAFQALVDDGVLPATLFTFLRHLMQHERDLSFIFAGTHKLEEIGSDYWSVLFNIALYRHVGFLSDKAAGHLIRDPVEPSIIYDDLAVEKILRVTAAHPYFLQLVCYTLVNRANSQQRAYITISDVNSGVEEMLKLGEVHFAYLWQQSSFVERALLSAASNLTAGEGPFLPVELVQYLNKYGIQLPPSDVTRGLNNLVKREIFQEMKERGKSYYDLRIGLVGIWVSQNKSLSQLYDPLTTRTRIDKDHSVREPKAG